MSVVRGRPPGLAGGMKAASRRYWSSLNTWPDPKAPTSKRSSRVHMAASKPERTMVTIWAKSLHRDRGIGCGGPSGWT